MRNDLSMVATGVRVKRYRYISPVETSKGTILQCSSEISGLLPENWRSRLGEILLKLLPAGSVTGAPKEATCRAIAEAEDMERGIPPSPSASWRRMNGEWYTRAVEELP